MNRKKLVGGLLAGAALAACIAIGAERAVAFRGGGFGGFHGGGGFRGFHGGGGFRGGSFGGGGARFGDRGFADRSTDAGFGRGGFGNVHNAGAFSDRRHIPAEPSRVSAQCRPVPGSPSGSAAKRVAGPAEPHHRGQPAAAKPHQRGQPASVESYHRSELPAGPTSGHLEQLPRQLGRILFGSWPGRRSGDWRQHSGTAGRRSRDLGRRKPVLLRERRLLRAARRTVCCRPAAARGGRGNSAALLLYRLVGSATDLDCGGAFYSTVQNGYQVVPPPIGSTVSALPSGAVDQNIDGTTYFVFGGAYYRPFYSGSSVIYQVVAKPA